LLRRLATVFFRLEPGHGRAGVLGRGYRRPTRFLGLLISLIDKSLVVLDGRGGRVTPGTGCWTRSGEVRLPNGWRPPGKKDGAGAAAPGLHPDRWWRETVGGMFKPRRAALAGCAGRLYRRGHRRVRQPSRIALGDPRWRPRPRGRGPAAVHRACATCGCRTGDARRGRPHLAWTGFSSSLPGGEVSPSVRGRCPWRSARRYRLRLAGL